MIWNNQGGYKKREQQLHLFLNRTLMTGIDQQHKTARFCACVPAADILNTACDAYINIYLTAFYIFC